MGQPLPCHTHPAESHLAQWAVVLRLRDLSFTPALHVLSVLLKEGQGDMVQIIGNRFAIGQTGTWGGQMLVQNSLCLWVEA